ncbi:hypothetical protein FRC19_003283 [Serendipita sp. 401]|nr:hypothetical protein FRC19_003283 [Serendipita sp. 401]
MSEMRCVSCGSSWAYCLDPAVSDLVTGLTSSENHPSLPQSIAVVTTWREQRQSGPRTRLPLSRGSACLSSCMAVRPFQGVVQHVDAARRGFRGRLDDRPGLQATPSALLGVSL